MFDNRGTIAWRKSWKRESKPSKNLTYGSVQRAHLCRLIESTKKNLCRILFVILLFILLRRWKEAENNKKQKWKWSLNPYQSPLQWREKGLEDKLWTPTWFGDATALRETFSSSTRVWRKLCDESRARHVFSALGRFRYSIHSLVEGRAAQGLCIHCGFGWARQCPQNRSRWPGLHSGSKYC